MWFNVIIYYHNYHIDYSVIMTKCRSEIDNSSDENTTKSGKWE